MMATFTAVRNAKQTAGTLAGVLRYVTQDEKTRVGDTWLAVGHNCIAQSSYMEMMTTKQQFKKSDGRQFYHFVQSFSADDAVTPQQVNAIGLELVQREFPEYEAVVATHIDTGHLHNHIVVNSVSFETGRKLHQNAEDLKRHRQASDEICLAHGLKILEPPETHSRKKRMKPGEYQAELRGESWKLELINTLNEALEYATSKESFIQNVEMEGYRVSWSDNRKYITFTCPNGMKCRNTSLRDDTFLKENLETLFLYRQFTDFRPGTEEPENGWMGQLANDFVNLCCALDQLQYKPPSPPQKPHWTDKKLLRRIARKKLAMGNKLRGHYRQTMSY